MCFFNVGLIQQGLRVDAWTWVARSAMETRGRGTTALSVNATAAASTAPCCLLVYHVSQRLHYQLRPFIVHIFEFLLIVIFRTLHRF